MLKHDTATEKAGYTINEWCPAAGISRATFYALPAESKPHHVYIGSRPVIKESPGAWLARMAEAGGVTIPKRKAKPAPQAAAA